MTDSMRDLKALLTEANEKSRQPAPDYLRAEMRPLDSAERDWFTHYMEDTVAEAKLRASKPRPRDPLAHKLAILALLAALLAGALFGWFASKALANAAATTIQASEKFQ